ncbi:DUF2237 family protein [Roseibium sp.]|uniref:DUF2237 family protein n=1 Tax=Roseibium sp. TaxID=1936156 RepID=UPI003B50244F
MTFSPPVPGYGFPRLKAGDGCYRCALQWRETHEAGAAPKIKVSASHERAAVHPEDVLLTYRIA